MFNQVKVFPTCAPPALAANEESETGRAPSGLCRLAPLRGCAQRSWRAATMALIASCFMHGLQLLSFRQPPFQQNTQLMFFAAAWSAFHLKCVIIMFVSSEILRCRLLTWLLDHPMNHTMFHCSTSQYIVLPCLVLSRLASSRLVSSCLILHYIT